MRADLEKLRDYALERREYCLEFRSSKFDSIFLNSLSKYEVQPSPTDANNIELPALYVRVETLLAHMLAEFFGYSESPLRAYGMKQTTHQRADLINMLWEYRARQTDFLLKMVPFFREAILLGSAVAYVDWEVRADWVLRRKPVYVLGIQLGKRRKRYFEVVYNGPKITVLDPLNFWVDPGAESCDLQAAADCGIERWMTREEIESLHFQGYFGDEALNIDWEKINGRSDGATGDYSNADKRREVLGLKEDGRKSGEIGRILVSEWWGRYRPKGSPVDVPMVVTVADPEGQKILLRPFGKLPVQGNNPYEHGRKPFVMMNYVTRDFCAWGRGIPEICDGTNDLYQKKVQSRLSNLNLLVNRMFARNKEAIRNKDQLVSRPGGVVDVEIGSGSVRDAIFPLEWPNLLPDISMILAELSQFLDELSGMDALMRSAPVVPGAKTPISAMEAGIRQKMAGQKFRFLTNLMMTQGPVKISDMILQLEKQFLQNEQEIMLLRQEKGADTPKALFQKIAPEDLEGDFNYFYVGDPLRANEMLRIQTQVATIGLLMNPFFTQMGVMPAGVVKPWETAKTLLGNSDMPWEELLLSETEMGQKLIEAYTQQASMQAEQASAGLLSAVMGQEQPPEEGGPSGGGNGKIKANAEGQPGSIQPQSIPGSTTEPMIQAPPIPSATSQVRMPPGVEQGGVMA